MKKVITLLPLGLALLGACSSAKDPGTDVDAKTITFNNFEAGGGWSNDPGRNRPDLVAKGKAHSGQYALVINKEFEFSLTFEMPLGQVSTTKFNKIHLSAWVFMPNAQASGTLGIQVIDPADNSKAIYNENLRFVDAVKKYNEWVLVEKDFTLPANITVAQHLRMFAWRADASESFLVDDVKLSILE